MEEKCPYCGEKMELGYIKTNNAIWTPDQNAPIGATNLLNRDAIVFASGGRFSTASIQAYKCSACHKIIFDYIRRGHRFD